MSTGNKEVGSKGKQPAPNGHEPPYARVHCPRHKVVYLTYKEYSRQLEGVGDKWRCPICRAESVFDDHWFDMVHNRYHVDDGDIQD